MWLSLYGEMLNKQEREQVVRLLKYRWGLKTISSYLEITEKTIKKIATEEATEEVYLFEVIFANKSFYVFSVDAFEATKRVKKIHPCFKNSKDIKTKRICKQKEIIQRSKTN